MGVLREEDRPTCKYLLLLLRHVQYQKPKLKATIGRNMKVTVDMQCSKYCSRRRYRAALDPSLRSVVTPTEGSPRCQRDLIRWTKWCPLSQKMYCGTAAVRIPYERSANMLLSCHA